MFRLSSQELRGRRVLIIEEDDQTAVLLDTAVRTAGGIVAGHVATVEDGLAFVGEESVDQALIHIRYTSKTPLLIPEVFAERGAQAIFLACHDDWFDFDDEVDGFPSRIAL